MTTVTNEPSGIVVTQDSPGTAIKTRIPGVVLLDPVTGAAYGAGRQLTLATVAAAGSLSAAVDLTNGTLAAMQLPADIGTATTITFQVSADGVTYADFYDTAGDEVELAGGAVIAESRVYAVNPTLFAGVRYLKVRFGTSAAANTDAAPRIVKLSVMK